MESIAAMARPRGSVGRSALVVGGTGFIGSHLVRQLVESAYQVTALGIRPPTAAFRFILGDALPEVDVRSGRIESEADFAKLIGSVRPEIVVHLAATADIALLNRQPEIGVRDFNVTFALLQAARRHDVGKVIYFSSTAALAPLQYEPIDAAHPLITPRHGPAGGIYGACKAAAELLSLTFSDIFDLDVRIVRAQSVYGVGMHGSVPLRLMVEGAVRGVPVHLPSGGQFPRDYTHIHDVCSLVLAMIQAPDDADRIFIPGTGRRACTGSEVATLIRDLVPGCDVTIAEAMTDAERADSRYRGQVSIESARLQLGWIPLYADLRGGLMEYIERHRAFLADMDRNSLAEQEAST